MVSWQFQKIFPFLRLRNFRFLVNTGKRCTFSWSVLSLWLFCWKHFFCYLTLRCCCYYLCCSNNKNVIASAIVWLQVVCRYVLVSVCLFMLTAFYVAHRLLHKYCKCHHYCKWGKFHFMVIENLFYCLMRKNNTHDVNKLGVFSLNQIEKI